SQRSGRERSRDGICRGTFLHGEEKRSRARRLCCPPAKSVSRSAGRFVARAKHPQLFSRSRQDDRRASSKYREELRESGVWSQESGVRSQELEASQPPMGLRLQPRVAVLGYPG